MRLLPLGSTIYLREPMLLAGLGSSKQWTANGKNETYINMVKHIVETDVGYWLYIPTGSHKGWREVSRSQVAWVKTPPPEGVLELVTAHEAALKKAALAEEAAKKSNEGATTGADTQEQTDADPAA